MQCFRNVPGAKNVMVSGGGVSRSSVENTFSHSAEKFLRGIFYCFINFRYRKTLGIREGGNTIFRRKKFRLPVPKIFVEERFCSVFQKFSGSEKVYG